MAGVEAGMTSLETTPPAGPSASIAVCGRPTPARGEQNRHPHWGEPMTQNLSCQPQTHVKCSTHCSSVALRVIGCPYGPWKWNTVRRLEPVCWRIGVTESGPLAQRAGCSRDVRWGRERGWAQDDQRCSVRCEAGARLTLRQRFERPVGVKFDGAFAFLHIRRQGVGRGRFVIQVSV
jgi:hypothetical protein